jgi:hypothetical protein
MGGDLLTNDVPRCVRITAKPSEASWPFSFQISKRAIIPKKTETGSPKPLHINPPSNTQDRGNE